MPMQLPPNGLELSGPAKARSEYRAELAGSAPLACGLGRERVVRRPRFGGDHPNLASDLVDLTLPWMSSSHPARGFTGASKSGTYGLMSRSGVPSRMSRLAKWSRVPSILSSLTIEMPIWLGLVGALVAKTPCGSEPRKGITVRSVLRTSWR